MAKNKLINGRAYDWNSIDIAVPGMQNIEITDISYGSKQRLFMEKAEIREVMGQEITVQM